jgi:phosphotriesterase-related protein
MAKMFTTLGTRTDTELGPILPHEHIMVDFRPPDHPEHGVAEAADVLALMAPEVMKARARGVTAMVDCTPVGVGRRADILKEVSEATGMPLVVPTGIYREPRIPGWARAAREAELTGWMLSELQEGIEASGVRAGWIKLGVSDDGLADCEIKILRAASAAAREANAVIGVHTARGRVVRDQLDIVEAMGYRAERFIWIHAQKEPDFTWHLEAARRGSWLEYDEIGKDDDYYLERIQRVLDAGLGDRLLISQDRGWYDPAKPGGGEPKPFTYLFDEFLPRLRAVGVDEKTIRQLVHANPFRAFAR